MGRGRPVGHRNRFLTELGRIRTVERLVVAGLAGEGRALQLSGEPIYSRILPAWAV
jgi:hypothetical protein